MSFGLIGAKLGHSCSPRIHALLGNGDYRLLELDESALGKFFAARDFRGINVTIPYKRAVLPLLDQVDERASRIGAVNTVVRGPDGCLIGYNTDFDGFQALCAYAGVELSGKRVLILGSGGTSQTVRAAAEAAGASEIRTVSRSGALNYETMYGLRDTEVLVNTTPVGMFPDNDGCPADPARFPNLAGVLDVVYNPLRTELVARARALGLPASGGLPMLVMQAVRAHELFFGCKVEPQTAARVLQTIADERADYVLIGMPGCGKSTIGALLAGKLGRKLVDADEEITRLAGKPIPKIFAEDGETVFRDWETKALSQLGKQSALVIATGGGCVTQMRNYPLLHQNGTIFWLKRDISKLPTDGRPLSQASPLDAMFVKRAPMYAAFADHAVSNDGTAEETVAAILSIMEEPI